MQTTTYRLESCSVYSYRQRLYSLIFLNAVQQTVRCRKKPLYTTILLVTRIQDQFDIAV